jgi:plastocyanin
MRCSRAKAIATLTVCTLLGLTLAGRHRGADADDKSDETTDDNASVVGVVKFDGERLRRKPLVLREKGGKLSDCHKLHDNPLLDESRIVSAKGELANVFIYVEKGLEKKSYPIPKSPALLNQEKCMFRPRVQGIQVGQEFLMRNSDPMTHNVRSFARRNRAFNVAQPAKSPDRDRVFTRGEGAVKLQCDIHPWMTAYYFVMEHPYFAVTNEKGQFKINGLPTGEYTLVAWHEEYGEQKVEITVAATGSTDVGFTFEDKAK